MKNFLKVLYSLLALNVISCVAALFDNITLYGKVGLSEEVFRGESIPFRYTLDKCIEQGYCPDTITTTEQLWDQVGTLNPSFLADTISALNTTFAEAATAREIEELEFPQLDLNNGRFIKGQFVKYEEGEIPVPDEVFVRRNKYIAMIIIYSIVSIGLYSVHHFKKRLSLEYQFKPSKVSKLMLNYLAFKTVFKFIYLALMFSYITGDSTKFNLGLLYLSCEDYIQGPVTFALAVLFAMGYGTRRFKIDASMAWKTVLLTACDVLFNLPGLLRALLIPYQRDWDSLFTIWLDSLLTTLYYVLISACTYIGYNTYKVDRDHRYLDSAKAIIIGILINPFVVVPKSFGHIRYFLGHGVVRSKNYTMSGMAIPDLIELVVIIYLVYVWRDIREKELEFVELENMET